MTELKFNDTATLEWTVGEADLATALASETADILPAVFCTPRLIALMEMACAKAMQPALDPGEVSAGTSIEMTHKASTLPGTKVTVTARFVGRDGLLYVFRVAARDPAGEIGHATHKRVILAANRLMAGALRRRDGVKN